MHIPKTCDNIAKEAKEYSDTKLAISLGTIYVNEKWHERVYFQIMKKLFENLNPNGAMLAFVNMMKKKIAMLEQLMYDGHNNCPFNDYVLVVQRTWGSTPLGIMLTSWTI